MNKIATINDLAKLAGVSPATVSIVLNEKPLAQRIAVKTRERIKTIAKEINYKPSHIAHCMQSQSTKTIGFICAELENPYFAELASHVARLTMEKGYKLIIQPTFWDIEREFSMLEAMSRREVDGILICSSIFSVQKERALSVCHNMHPLVVLNDPNVTDFSSVYFDLNSGMEELFSSLTSKGITNIALAHDIRFPAKVNVYNNMCEKFGVKSQIFNFTVGSLESVKDCARDIAKNIPEALLVTSDWIGTMIFSTLYDLGIKMVDDYLAVTIDGTQLSEYYSPSISSIKQDTEILADKALSELFRKLKDKDSSPQQIALPTTFNELSSTKIEGGR